MANVSVTTAFPTAISTAISATGANANTFAIPVRQNNMARTIAFSAVGASAVPTTVTANLESSHDGGTTWQIYASAIAFVAATVATTQIVQNVCSGLLYRFNVTTFTVGSAVTVTIWATVD